MLPTETGERVTRLKAMNTMWVSQTARIARHCCGTVADATYAADLVAWEQSLSQLRERKLRPDGRGPLKEGATREAVRVALLKGKYPHRWVKDAWSLSSTTPREGTWVPSQPLKPASNIPQADGRGSGGST